MYPCTQMQFGVWLTTLHSAFSPQTPGQGSLHLLFIQANVFGHSLLLIHSGLQLGGCPLNSGRHEQLGDSLITLHMAFDPHGDGWQGFILRSGSSPVI